MSESGEDNHCCLCWRNNLTLTFHHLIPKKMHDKKYVKKRHPNIEFNRYGIYVCRSCHKLIHKKISHKELALNYYSKELLLENDIISKAVLFNSNQNKNKMPK